MHPKDPVPGNRRKGVVYSIPCAECPCTYIDQTSRSLDHRLCEHHRALKNRVLGSSALAEQVFSSSGSIKDHGDWHPQPHPDPLHAGALAYPTPPVPAQQGEGHFARTLYCTTDLTVIHLASCHYCVVHIINLPISLFLYFFTILIYLYLFFHFNDSLVSYLLHCTRLCPIVILILSPPPPFPI